VLVYKDGALLLAQPEPNTHHTYHTMPGTLYAFDAKDGRPMWKHGYGAWGHCTPPDVFVVGDAVWTHVDAKTEYGSVWGSGYGAKNPNQVNYRIQALDLRTGKVRKELPTKDIFNVGHHHRCYRNKITERFLMSSRRGVEFVDLATGENWQNHWVRSGCLLGNLPCNGLLYVAPHPCGCYIDAKLIGFNALAPAAKSKPESRVLQTADRLHRGPAYGQIRNPKSEIRNADDWPTYRHDGRRSGATESAVAPELKVAWQADIGTRPSGLVVAGGKVLLAGVDAHTVYALGAGDGKTAWTFTAGARVDSPPTVHNGLAIFGSADGRVTCLRASDGALAWRFDAAPEERRVTAFGRLESPWPVPGSVLVEDGTCWLAAGRSSYLDGGIHLWALDPATGKVTKQETIYHADPKTGKMTPETNGFAMTGLLNDIPGTDGAGVFIRQMKVFASGGGAGVHLYTTGGFLDPTWFNRTLWKAGRAQTSGVMVLGKDVAYGVEIYGSRSRETVFKPGAANYRLACYSLRATADAAGGKGAKPKQKRQQGPTPVWQQRVPIRITAMVRAGETLFVAGSPDVVDPNDPHGAWEGRKGGVLAAFAASDGKQLAERKLAAPPVWDGMAAAGGRLYLSTMDGKVVCFAAP
ncbi:MAG TPA: PQQ-binding-like beta-propeller repeat protein, partial [Phycisphaerae bacterium]|nr:PQQ-binding-like beta-propeller repeat protein [Phycisphaerae bacterium]